MKRNLQMLLSVLLVCSCANSIEYSDCGDYTLVTQSRGRSLSTADRGNVIVSDGLAFKDLNHNGSLEPYEDWRLPSRRRAEDLASRMSLEEIAGLMIFSTHQAIASAELTDYQKSAIADNMRHFLVTKVESPRVAASWNNAMQRLCEQSRFGIPANNSSDPRHGTVSDDEFNYGAGGKISIWPGLLGMSATFDPSVARRFGEVASIEYRALGLATALSPQIDLSTEPRWRRVFATFGEGVDLAVKFAREYTDGFQTSSKAFESGWGMESVNAMIKHWPGGGTGEAGRDAHFSFGKYAVYPGGNFEEHLRPFTEGGLALKGPTRMAAAVMPYYTVSYGIDPSGENVANAFSKYMIQDLLRGKYGFEGLICTDWGVVNEYTDVYTNNGKPWGFESLSEDELTYKALMNTIDQFGNVYDTTHILEAYRLMSERNGVEFARSRFEQSATRLLVNIFHVGLFENPYLDVDRSESIVGCTEFMEEGFDAQCRSVVMLKNASSTLPLKEGIKVYIPERRLDNGVSYWSGRPHNDAKVFAPVGEKLVSQYFEQVTDPAEADAALVFIEGPIQGRGFDIDDYKAGGSGYIPISLQYADYTAEYAREESIAGGDPFEKSSNRSYIGRTVSVQNRADADIVRETREAIGPDKPLVLVVAALRPLCFGEVEPYADAILTGFEVQNQAYMEIVSGRREPSGLLPVQMPLDMKTVEMQSEDLPFDMDCYVDSEGNVYDYAYGLNWKGVIRDARVRKYTPHQQ